MVCEPEFIQHAQARMVKEMDSAGLTRTAELTKLRARVGVLEKQIANIVSAIANGEKSGSIKGALADYEKELTASRQIIADLEREDRLNPIVRSEKQSIRHPHALEELRIRSE